MPFLIREALNTGKTSDTHLIFITAAAIAAGAAAEAAARSCDAAFPTQQYNVHPRSAALTVACQRLALGMADGERSPLLSDLGDGAVGSGNGGLSPGAAPYGVPSKPQSEYPWCSLLHPTPAWGSLAHCTRYTSCSASSLSFHREKEANDLNGRYVRMSKSSCCKKNPIYPQNMKERQVDMS